MTSPRATRVVTPTSLPSVSALAESSGRLLIPLSPQPASAEVDDHHDNASNPRALLDYLSRLSRYEPRLRRFYSSKGTESREPIEAFMVGSKPGSVTPSSASPTSGPESKQGHGFSLVDLEHWVFSRMWGSSTSAAPSAPIQEDSSGLNIDLSEIFGRQVAVTDGTVSRKTPFLNYYSKENLIQALSTTGILAALAKKGYSHPSLVFDTSDSFQHRLSLVDSALFAPDLHLTSSDAFLVVSLFHCAK